MEHSIRVSAELILSKLVEKYRLNHSEMLKDSRFARYETHYALIFNTRKFNITTTIKLNLDFSLIGVYTWIPEESKSRINDPLDARDRLNTRFLGYLESIVMPGLKTVGVAA